MRYGKIPSKILDIIISEGYGEDIGFYDITLRNYLDDVGQDIICSNYEVDNECKNLLEFTAWTKYTVFQLSSDGIDKFILSIDRHPYSFIYRG